MPRYCHQRDNYSCGPIALLNLSKWAFPKCFFSLADLFTFRRWLQCTKDGTSVERFDQQLCWWIGKKYIRKTFKRDIDEMWEWIKKGNALVFEYPCEVKGKKESHFAICTEVIRGDLSNQGFDSFYVINDEYGNTERAVSWYVFDRMLAFYSGQRTHLWFVKKP